MTYVRKTAKEEAMDLAQEFVEHFKDKFNFAPHVDKIAEDINDYVYNGNWDHTIDVEVNGVPCIRVIQEDEYDQHMDEDDEDTPSYDEVDYVGGYYVMLVD
ncbi:hypothetical protein DQT32_03640 [Salmonella enterica subsp. enterica serovar Braenderup]|nr:hypothetical protein [Salmonella enterica subsp. enterica serovar Braenderup]